MKGGKQESRIIPPQFTERQWDRTVQVLRLTPTEANVVALVLSGRADKEMQGEMKMAYPTVRAHLRAIFSKVDVHSRTELVLRVLAIRDGMKGP